MIVYSTLNYVAFTLMFALVLLEADGPYIYSASLIFVALGFVGPHRMKMADLEAKVPRSQYKWLFVAFAFIFFPPLYRAHSGIDVLDAKATPGKILMFASWFIITLLFFRNVYFQLKKRDT